MGEEEPERNEGWQRGGGGGERGMRGERGEEARKKLWRRGYVKINVSD